MYSSFESGKSWRPGTREAWAQECPFPFQGLLGAQNGPKDPNNVTGPTGPNGPSDPNDLTGPNGPNDPDDQNNPTMNQCRHFIIKKKNLLFIKLPSCHFIIACVIIFKLSSCNAIFRLTDVTQFSLTGTRGHKK